jgi:hypothetical protein
MAALSSYTPIATYTVTTAQTDYTFTSIPSTYTDLILVIVAANGSSDIDINLRVNGDTASNYSWTSVLGTGASALSSRASSQSSGRIGNMSGSNAGSNTVIVNFFDYANTTTYKTIIARENNASNQVAARVNSWRKTPEAITSISVIGQISTSATFVAGSTFSLYGIANNTAGAKATGGVISSDSSYFYHSFYATGTFTPTQSLSCDYLVVAGGGGGGHNGGGGGAGGYKTSIGGSPLSVTATGYTITVGAGGAGGTTAGTILSAGQVGTNSVFSSITSTGGGGGGTGYGYNPTAGGSGGGAQTQQTGGAATPSGQGNAGGNGGTTGGVPYAAGGGGGAGAVGANGVDATSTGGNGGIGLTSTLNVQSLATYYAGGGGGAGYTVTTVGTGGTGGGGNAGTTSVNPQAGTVNTGGGGGGDKGATYAGGAGGSGVVIIRYAR